MATSLRLCVAMGVAVGVAGCPLVLVTPAQWRRCLGLSAKATKAQASAMVGRVLSGWTGRESQDERDAAAIAYAAGRMSR